MAAGKAFNRLSDPEPIVLKPFTPDPTPTLSRKDPSVPTFMATGSSKPPPPDAHCEQTHIPWYVSVRNAFYNREDRTFCSRTCSSWGKILAYAVMYLIFLSTYTLILLYISLVIIKNTEHAPSTLSDLLVYSPETIGLSATPLSEHNYPLIWYRRGEPDDVKKYVRAIDELVRKRRIARDLVSHLGPCGESPYGYEDKPCVLIRINKQMRWAGKPLQLGTAQLEQAPLDVQKWVRMDSNKYWIHCKGDQNYDKEHIGEIKYHPYPPGIDSSLFPLDAQTLSPLVAIQLSNYTLGVSLAVECKLWYEGGVSAVAFMFYVSPKNQQLRCNDTSA